MDVALDAEVVSEAAVTPWVAWLGPGALAAGVVLVKPGVVTGLDDAWNGRTGLTGGALLVHT